MEKLAYNYENIVSKKFILEGNRNKMQELFDAYKRENAQLDENWMGKLRNSSREEMEKLIISYNGFLEKVQGYIDVLQDAYNRFESAEHKDPYNK